MATWPFAVKVKVAQSCLTLCDPMDCIAHGILQAKNAGVGSLSLLQGIFPTQGSNPGLPHCRQILYQMSHKGSPRILEWVVYPFSSRSSRPRNWTGVSCIADGFFTNWPFAVGNGKELKTVEGGLFPGGPVAKTPQSQCRGTGFDPGRRTSSHRPQLRVCLLQLKILHAVTKTQHSQINKNKILKNVGGVCQPRSPSLSLLPFAPW